MNLWFVNLDEFFITKVDFDDFFAPSCSYQVNFILDTHLTRFLILYFLYIYPLLWVGCAVQAQTKLLRIPLKTLLALKPSVGKYQYHPSIPWQSIVYFFLYSTVIFAFIP